MHSLLPFAALTLALCCAACTGETTDQTPDPAGASEVEVDTTGMELVVLSVEGMTCADACAPEVQRQLAEVQGVGKVEVDFEAATARCWVTPGLDPKTLAEALTAEGLYTGSVTPPAAGLVELSEG